MIYRKENMASPAYALQPIIRTSLQDMKCVRFPRSVSYRTYSFYFPLLQSRCLVIFQMRCFCSLAHVFASGQKTLTPLLYLVNSSSSFFHLSIWTQFRYSNLRSPPYLVCYVASSSMTTLTQYFLSVLKWLGMCVYFLKIFISSLINR